MMGSILGGHFNNKANMTILLVIRLCLTRYINWYIKDLDIPAVLFVSRVAVWTKVPRIVRSTKAAAWRSRFETSNGR